MLLYKHIALYTFNVSTYTHIMIPGNAGRFFIIPNISSGCSRMNFVIEKNRPVGTQQYISIYNALWAVVRRIGRNNFFIVPACFLKNRSYTQVTHPPTP